MYKYKIDKTHKKPIKRSKQIREEFLAKNAGSGKEKEEGAAIRSMVSEEAEKRYPLLNRQNEDVIDETNEVIDEDLDGDNEITMNRSKVMVTSSGYLEPVNRFPIPDEPITATNNNRRAMMSNIKTNPHMRLTQV